MYQKVGYIRNPLTVIAIFAAVAEISGTTVLPFIETANQATYVWFLMLFPTLLVVVFFLTLNFNHKVLYAPSDYKDEGNFLKMFGRATPQEREEKLKEEVDDAEEAEEAEQSPSTADASALGSEDRSSKIALDDRSNRGKTLMANIALAERLAINQLSKRLGFTMRTDVRFMTRSNRSILFDALGIEGDNIHAAEVKLIRHAVTAESKFEKILLECERITRQLPDGKKFTLHIYAVIDDEPLPAGPSVTVDIVKEKFHQFVAKYDVKVDVNVVTLESLKRDVEAS